MQPPEQPRWRPTRKQLLWTLAALAIVADLTVAVLIGYRYDITLWNWIKLLIFPAVIAGGGLWFNRHQREWELDIAREQRESDEAIADERPQEDRKIAQERAETDREIATKEPKTTPCKRTSTTLASYSSTKIGRCASRKNAMK